MLRAAEVPYDLPEPEVSLAFSKVQQILYTDLECCSMLKKRLTFSFTLCDSATVFSTLYGGIFFNFLHLEAVRSLQRTFFLFFPVTSLQTSLKTLMKFCLICPFGCTVHPQQLSFASRFQICVLAQSHPESLVYTLKNQWEKKVSQILDKFKLEIGCRFLSLIVTVWFCFPFNSSVFFSSLITCLAQYPAVAKSTFCLPYSFSPH